MTTQISTSAMVTAPGRSRGAALPLLAGAVGFVLFYVSNDFVVPNLASSALPLPDAPAADARAWFADNQLAAIVSGLVHAVSVTCLAVFVAALRRSGSAERRAALGRAVPWGFGAVGLMYLATVLACVLAAVAPSTSDVTAGALRTANFIAGGTAHVLALGVFVLFASRAPGTSRRLRILARVAAVPAVLALSSLVVWQGAAFILLGRLLCMIWVVSAAVSLTRSGTRTVPGDVDR
jgi:hypothetical protein